MDSLTNVMVILTSCCCCIVLLGMIAGVIYLFVKNAEKKPTLQ